MPSIDSDLMSSDPVFVGVTDYKPLLNTISCKGRTIYYISNLLMAD